MHSKIFQVCSHPIDPQDYKQETDYLDREDRRYTDGYDYLNGNAYAVATCYGEDRHQALCDLRMQLMNSAKVEQIPDPSDKGKSVYVITIVDKDRYFMTIYENFLSKLKSIGEYSFDAFSNEYSHAIIKYDLICLNSIDSNEYGFYMNDMDNGMKTLNDFMRSVSNGDRFYIGAVTDYCF